MSYQLEITRQARKDLNRLPDSIAIRIDKKIRSLADDPFPHGYVKLANTDKGYRVRVGDYRILYSVKARTIIIGAIGHRKDIYRF